MARKLVLLLFCLLALPSSATAASFIDSRVAYVSDRDGNDEIYSAPFTSYFFESNLTNSPADDRAPAYSTDGSRIAFVSDRSGRSDIWVMNWDGSRPQRMTTGDPASFDATPAWSPDGQQIVFSSSRGDGEHLWVVRLADGNLRQLTIGAGTSPAWSPDGSRIAYAGDGSIRVVSADGTDDHQLTYCFCAGAAGSPAWSRDGTYLIFARDDESSSARQLYFVTSTGGGGTGGIPITTGSYRYDHPTFSPDGSFLAFQRQDAAGGSEELYLEFGPGADTQYPFVTAPGRNLNPSWGPKFGPPPPPPDTTPPTITINTPAAPTTSDRTDVYTVGQVVLADYSCTDADSGIRHCEGSVPSGDPVDTRSIGTYEFVVFAADQAGNPVYKRTHYTVVYAFEGFAKPISGTGLTGMKAGDGVPLKFSLHGAYGLDAVTATTQQPIDCTSHAALATPAPAAGTLTYNASQDRYMFVWSTMKSWSGGCRAVTVTLRDGTAHRTDIRFTK
jgi:Tol biopolymer transport system component